MFRARKRRLKGSSLDSLKRRGSAALEKSRGVSLLILRLFHAKNTELQYDTPRRVHFLEWTWSSLQPVMRRASALPLPTFANMPASHQL